MLLGIISGSIFFATLIALLIPVINHLLNFKKKFLIPQFKKNLIHWFQKIKTEIIEEVKTKYNKSNKLFLNFMMNHSKEKLYISMLILPISLIIFIDSFSLNARIPNIINLIIFIMLLSGLFWFFSKPGGFHKWDNLGLYLVKLMTFLQILLLLVLLVLQNPENYSFLLFTIIFTIVYSFALFRSVQKDLRGWKLIQLFNAGFSIIIIFSTIGLALGSYYYAHNDILGFFNSKEITFISKDASTTTSILSLICKGWFPFYSPIENMQLVLIHPGSFMLLVKLFLESIVKPIIVGILVSCLSSFLLQRINKKTNMTPQPQNDKFTQISE